jgi:hypothetical protein
MGKAKPRKSSPVVVNLARLCHNAALAARPFRAAVAATKLNPEHRSGWNLQIAGI